MMALKRGWTKRLTLYEMLLIKGIPNSIRRNVCLFSTGRAWSIKSMEPLSMVMLFKEKRCGLSLFSFFSFLPSNRSEKLYLLAAVLTIWMYGDEIRASPTMGAKRKIDLGLTEICTLLNAAKVTPSRFSMRRKPSTRAVQVKGFRDILAMAAFLPVAASIPVIALFLTMPGRIKAMKTASSRRIARSHRAGFFHLCHVQTPLVQ